MRSTMFLTMSMLLLPALADLLAAQSMGIIPNPGQPLPEITLPSLDGSLMTTNDLRGKPIVLHLFASW